MDVFRFYSYYNLSLPYSNFVDTLIYNIKVVDNYIKIAILDAYLIALFHQDMPGQLFLPGYDELTRNASS